jgi:hypothetical protein
LRGFCASFSLSVLPNVKYGRGPVGGGLYYDDFTSATRASPGCWMNKCSTGRQGVRADKRKIYTKEECVPRRRVHYTIVNSGSRSDEQHYKCNMVVTAKCVTKRYSVR